MKLPKNRFKKSILRYFIRYRLCAITIEPAHSPGKTSRKAYRWEALWGPKKLGEIGLTAKTTDNQSEWWLHSLEVHPEMRNLGIGSKLIRQVLARTKKEGSPHLYLTVLPESPAVRLYKKFGFIETGKKDEIQNLIEMKKTF